MSHYSLAAERGEHGLVKINTTFLHVNLQPKAEAQLLSLSLERSTFIYCFKNLKKYLIVELDFSEL